MIVTKENQRLYPSTWTYNAARIITELARIAENNGAKVKYDRYSALISNRSIDSAIFETSERIKKLEKIESEKPGVNAARANAIKEYRAELERLENINNDPIKVTHTSYITFVLDDMYYYYQLGDNPFFDFHYIKTPVNNGKYSRDAALMDEPKEWLYDCFFKFDCSNADITEGANLIFNMLMNAEKSEIIRDRRRERVPNTYNSGYHYETFYSPERFAEIDF